MFIKKNILITTIFITSLYNSTAYSMLTRLRPLAQTKKVHLRKYTTIKESKDLKKLAARQFILKDPLSIATMYTLLTHHTEKLEGLQIAQLYPCMGMVFSSIPLLDLMYSIIDNHFMLLFPLHITAPVAIASVASLYALSDPLDKRMKLVKTLKDGFSTGKISLPDLHYIQNITQEDIAAKMKHLQIIPTKDISHFGKKDEALQYKWDINNPEILKNTLDGNYNSSDYVLYLQHKE